eukprot:404966-Amphidinium_carterae.1
MCEEENKKQRENSSSHIAYRRYHPCHFLELTLFAFLDGCPQLLANGHRAFLWGCGRSMEIAPDFLASLTTDSVAGCAAETEANVAVFSGGGNVEGGVWGWGVFVRNLFGSTEGSCAFVIGKRWLQIGNDECSSIPSPLSLVILTYVAEYGVRGDKASREAPTPGGALSTKYRVVCQPRKTCGLDPDQKHFTAMYVHQIVKDLIRIVIRQELHPELLSHAVIKTKLVIT